MKRSKKVSESEDEQHSEEDIASDDQEINSRNDDLTDNEKKDTTATSPPPTKKRKRGIIYLSTIPKHMTVAIAREMFGQYAKIGRMFFQPETKTNGAGKKIYIHTGSNTIY